MKHKFLSFLITIIFFAILSEKIMPQEVVLQDKNLLVSFNSASGALIRLSSKATGWAFERRPELGVSFRLHAPMPERRDNFVLGQKQKAVEVKKLNESQIEIVWDNLISENGGVLPIKFTSVVSLKDGRLSFESTLENRSNLTVETVDYPYFGDVCVPAKNAALHARTMWYGNLQSDEIYPHFANAKGYWGVFSPMKTFDSNKSLFCLLQSQVEGLYVGMEDATQPYLLQYTFEMKPGVQQSIGNSVFQNDQAGVKPSALEFRTTHFIFTAGNSVKKLVPVNLEFYRGDWHSGVDIYKKWRTTWFKSPRIPDWVKDVNSWQQLQINSPEQDYRVKYSELVKYGEECARNGVGAIQLVGWNKWGQDGGDPAQDTDPGLGTWQELYDAIQKIQAMGVKIILFGKLNWADMTTDWYKKELYKYAATDPYGIPYQQGGYSYFTPTQLTGINNHRRVVMDFASPGYRDLITKEFKKVLDLDAAGWLFDENCHHGPVKYSFAADHGYTAPGYIFSGDMPLAYQLRKEAEKKNPDYLFAGEGHMDWLMQYYPCSYFRIQGNTTHVDRYIDPKAPLVVAVTGFDDREMLNEILLNRYIISYEPYNFKGHLEDYPLTLAYGKKIDELRRKYKEYIWDADFQDTKGASVTSDGACKYTVFITSKGKRAVIVVNEDSKKTITVKVTVPKAGKFALASPENPESVPSKGMVKIPFRSAVVLMEQ